MSPRLTLFLLVCLLLCGSLCDARRPLPGHRYKRPHSRIHHHQGETLAKPEEFLDGVDLERFQDVFEESYAKTTRDADQPGQYLVGAGIGDVTGQVAEIGFMGYAQPTQKGGGLLGRPRSRAFIFVDANGVDDMEGKAAPNRVVYVSIDLCMGFQMVKLNVIDKLAEIYGPDLYTHANVMISGTHTHATPGGLGGTVLVDITTFGFIKENHNAAVDGIVQSIVRAHNNIQPANVKMAIGQCDGCNANRSPSAYLLDPEIGAYANNTDHEMTVLRIESTNGTELGMISWFAVHGTSLNNTNPLVSGDNKGYAAYLFEKAKNPNGTLPGAPNGFVAAFGQSNLGDVSPNTRGAHCPDGSPCDFNTSTCGNPPRNEECIATGPGVDQYDSMRIIGYMQHEAAMNLYNSASDLLTNEGIDYRYQYFDMQNTTVSPEFTSTGQTGQTCRPAMGYSFAAGTTDGPGDFDFHQSTTSPNPFWQWVTSFLAKPPPDQIACQAPKPILIDVGVMEPIEWVPYILPEQVYRIGNLWILGVPGEFTTMAGRRTRAMVKSILQSKGEWYDNSQVVIAGLSNSYSSYITTYEEYQQQRYEGASTLYGPHTLAAHMQNYAGLVNAMVDGESVPTGPIPMDMRNHTFCFMPGVVEDSTPSGISFGAIATDVQPSYTVGETVSVVFWGASPRNELFLESSYFFVDQLQSDGVTWTPVITDGDYHARFLWTRVGVDQSHCGVEWDLSSENAPAGRYRIRHQGVSKSVLGALTHYNGTSSVFTVGQ